jgi:type I restriction-modification system DNA methylase subunit/predicted DNA-binding transcriptional regulator AlpA
VEVFDSEALVSLADLAEMAGVTRPAVSNWRRRNPDFPRPVRETGATSLFRLADLRAWMRAHSKRLQAPSVDQQLWSSLNRMRGEVRPDEAAQAAMILLGYLALESRLDSHYRGGLAAVLGVGLDDLNRYLWRLHQEAVRLGFGDIFGDVVKLDDHLSRGWPEYWPFLIEAVDLASRVGIGQVFEGLIAAADRGSRGAGEYVTPQSVADLVATLATPINGTVLDPACGYGSFLITASRKATKPLRLTGQDIDPSACRITRLRMFVHGLHAEVAQGNTLKDGPLVHPAEADLIMADPPLGAPWRPDISKAAQHMPFGAPPPSRAEMAWLQDGIMKLRPGGRAMYLLGAGSLFRGGRERDIRCRLIEAGAVEAIITLPSALYPATTTPMALWIVGRPRKRNNDTILLVDAASLGRRHRNRTELSDSDIAAIHGCYQSWLAGSHPPAIDGVRAAAISVKTLLAGDGTLIPDRWAQGSAQDPRHRLQRIRNARRELEAAGHVFSQALPPIPGIEITEGEASHSAPTARLGELARIIRPRRIDGEAAGTGTMPLIRSKDLGVDLWVTPSGRVDNNDLTSASEVTEPGDVVVLPDGAKPRAAVDHGGGALVGAPLQIVRPLHRGLDPIVLAALITLFGPRYAVGSTVKHVDLFELEVPYPDSQLASWLRRALETLGEQRRQALAAVQAIDDLKADLVEGLCTRTLKLGDSVFDGTR